MDATGRQTRGTTSNHSVPIVHSMVFASETAAAANLDGDNGISFDCGINFAESPAIDVFSLRPGPQPVQCFRYDFLPPVTMLPQKVPPGAAQAREKRAKPQRKTRFKPPSDVVKLRDRIYYLLQPPLEWTFDGELQLPFEPFPYQYQGISFLYPRHAAVLADEMGLGKTMQAITTTRLLLHAGEVRSVVLICPKPLISNWQREFALWAPEIPVTVISGKGAQREWAWQRPEFPVKIANYESVLRDSELVQNGTISADLVVLDEAQRIKNLSSSTSCIIREIDRRRSWALTGTPIENSSDDLVGIFEFLIPGMLRRGMSPRNMANATCDHILRRTKDEVLTDLPPKLFRDATLELSPEQQASYVMAEQEGVLRLENMGEEITIQHVFELVLRLKQICNFDPATGASSKLERLEADLEEVSQSGKQAIIFSQWVDTLEKIADRLQRFRPLQYHGRISNNAREQAIKDFREKDDHTVLLISYGAGSVGLNLQFANYVFLFDRWWNPAVEDQAINRAHRIGSSGPVTINRFVTPGTIEQRIDNVLRDKRALMDAILGNQDGPRQMGLSQDEIFGLFDLKIAR